MLAVDVVALHSTFRAPDNYGHSSKTPQEPPAAARSPAQLRADRDVGAIEAEATHAYAGVLDETEIRQRTPAAQEA